MVKSKVRFDGLDVAAMVAHWNRVALGRRVINIYNGPNGDTYIFKLDKRSAASNSTSTTTDEKKDNTNNSNSSNLLLLMESGVRFHTSQTPYENPGMPSQFCAKLRKHLRGLRLEQVTQLGNMDRVVHLVFGSGDAQRHSLMLEFYARGNIVLTNSSYTILSLLRSHEYTATNNNKKVGDEEETTAKNDTVQVKVGHAYPVTYATTMTAEDAANSTAENDAATDDESDDDAVLLTAKNPLAWFQNQPASKQTPAAPTPESSKKKKKDSSNSSQNAWKSLLLTPASGVSHYGPSLLEHCLHAADLWGVDKKFPVDMTAADEWTALQSILQQEGGKILGEIQTQESKGYLLYQEKKHNGKSQQDDKDNVHVPPSPFHDKILLEFQPHLLLQHQDMPRLEYETFDRAVDIFFSHIESQKLMLRAEQQQAQAEQRLEKIRLDQKSRVTTLMKQQELLQEQAQLVELHADMVEKALQVVNSALDNGMDWDQLEDLVELEKTQNHNPVAMLIHKLDLEHDQMVLRLTTEDALYDDENDDNSHGDVPPYRDVTLSLHETAHGNATALFAKYRASKEKSQKTIEASTKALEAAEENAKKQLLEAQTKKSNVTIQAKRKPLWFEKFNWFVTSDNYLVLGGRDAQQNELLVKRYLRAGDAYLHADVHGAASCILRAKRRRDSKTGKTSPIPLSSQALREAGNFTICRSSAWSSRMVTSAWWVESHQVSKTAPTGEYLTVGSFMVRGKKNFLPPSQLEMGLGVLFRLGDDDSIIRHKNERRDFALIQMDEEDEIPFEDDVSPIVIKRVEKKSEAQTGPKETPLSKSKETNGTKIEEKPHLDSNIDELQKSTEKHGHGNDSTKVPPGSSPDSSPEDNGRNNDTKEEDAPALKKKGLSVKERKLIKKYGSLEAAEEAEEERKRQEEATEDASDTMSAITELTSQPGGKQMNHKRGKKAKLKRMAKKYADQDDDDRDLALLLLQGGEKEKQKDKKKAPLINETEKEAAAETLAILTKDAASIAQQLPEKVQDTLATCVVVVDAEGDEVVKWDKFDGDVLQQLLAFEQEEPMQAAADRLVTLKGTSRIDNFSASLAGIIRTIKKYGHQGLNSENKLDNGADGRRKKKAEKVAEDESWKKALAEEGITEGGDEDEEGLDDTVELSKLTGKPQNEDLLLFAVPVCAPYQTLNQYAYRVKLTPGNMKRGKASKQCVDMFLKDGSKAPGADRYREMIKKVVDNEWVQSICGDVKISAAGAAKAIQKSKAKAKAKGGGKKKK